MIQPVIILSRTSIAEENLENAFMQYVTWMAGFRQLDVDIAIELPVRRAGKKGWFADNPPIDIVDRWFNYAAESHCRFASLLIPIELDQSEKNTGQEISAIDGWTDLAAYAEITLVRLSLLHPEALEKSHVQKMFLAILDYLAEMEIRVSLQVPDGAVGSFPGYLNDILHQPEPSCGLDLRVDPHSLFPAHTIGLSPTTISVLLQQPPDADAIQSMYNRLRSGYGETLKAVVFEWE